MNEKVNLLPTSNHDNFTTQSIGFEAESIALVYLKSQNFRLLERNWRYKNHHEIDLIMLNPKNDLIGVEVRSLSNQSGREPFETIQSDKITRIKEALTIYAQMNKKDHLHMQIDVVSVSLPAQVCEHFEAVDINW